MLGKLVNKFKRQTLQDGCDLPIGQMSPPPGGRSANTTEIGTASAAGTRRSARLNEKAEKEKANWGTGGALHVGSPNSPSPPNTRARRAQLEAEQERTTTTGTTAAVAKHQQQHQQAATTGGGGGGPMLCDSGTESDDDELEMLDSLSNASRAALEDGIGRSPPTLTSSPPLISEIDTSSWDSCGCESGIVLRDSAERDDASRNLDLLEAAFGGGELVMEIRGKKAVGNIMMGAGTTPVQSKDPFPAHFRSAGTGSGSGGTVPMPIDFSALRHSELHGGDLLADDAPTPIGSQKGTGNGAMLMEMAQLENQQKAAQQNEAAAAQQQQQPPSSQQQHHQGAFRRVLRRTRRNSNSQQQPQQQQPQQPANNTTATTGSIAGRTVSPSGGTGVGEKRRWEAQAATAAAAAVVAGAAEPNGQQQHQQQASQEAAAIESMPIAARTRGSLLMGMLGVGSGGGGGGGQQQSIDAAASADGLSRPVLTAARRTRVRVLYSQDHNQHQKANNNNTGGFPVPGLIHGRRGQVAPMLGQSPPNMLVANKRGRHCAKASTSPPRPSLNFDKMRKRMLSQNSGGAIGGNGASAANSPSGGNGFGNAGAGGGIAEGDVVATAGGLD